MQCILTVLYLEASTHAGSGAALNAAPDPHEHLSDVEYRETAGTPDVLGIIRTGLCLQLQMSLGISRMHAISHAYTMRAINVWRLCPGLHLVGADRPAYLSHHRMPFVSFNVFVRRFDVRPPSDPYGGLDADAAAPELKWLHPLYVAQLLNDVYGIQVHPHAPSSVLYKRSVQPKVMT